MDYLLSTAEQLRQQLRALRKKRGLTQAALGALIGVSQARMVEIEANPGSVGLQQILQAIQALGACVVIRDEQPDATQEGSPARRTSGALTTRIKKGSW